MLQETMNEIFLRQPALSADATRNVRHAGLQAEALERVLRAAVQIGFFELSERTPGQTVVANNALSDVLRADHYSALKPLVSRRLIFIILSST